MNFFKRFFSKKRNIWILSSILFVFLIFFLIMAIYGPWWKIWPSGIKARIALNRLAISVYNEPYCRSNCYFQRLEYKREIERALVKKRIFKKVSGIIFNESENLNWRIELLSVLSPPDMLLDLQEYLNNPLMNLDFQRAISLKFKGYLDTSIYLDNLKAMLLDNFKSSFEKIETLKNLSSLDYILSDFYLLVLISEYDEDLIIELLRALASDEGLLDLDQDYLFNYLENLLRSPQSSFSAKRLSLFILSDFLNNDIDDRVHNRLSFLSRAGELDDFTRYILLDILGEDLGENDLDWDWYHGEK